MDPSVRLKHSEDRRAQQALYEKEGFVGEGAFGVVMKAVVKQPTIKIKQQQQQQHDGSMSDNTAAASSTSSIAPSSSTVTSTTASSSSTSASSASKKQYVAIKQMMNFREGQGIPQDAYREIKILKELRHEQIVSLDRIFTRPNKLEVDLVYEYADHDLAEIIKVNRAKLQHSSQQPDSRFVKSVLQQLLQGLAFLHKNWCMHRDMKPANVLVTGVSSEAEDGGGKVKIADFGLARIFQSPLRKLSDDGEVVTIWYRAIELLLGSKHYTRAIDCFAVGCIFFEIATCQPLFPGKEVAGSKVFQEAQVREVFKMLGKPTVEQWKGMVDCPYYQNIKSWPQKDYHPPLMERRLPAFLSPAGRNLLMGLLTYDPALRLTADQALAHPYFKEEPRPDRNVFRDVNGQILQYPVRPSKPISAAKRGREGEIAAAAVGNAQHPQPPLHPHPAAAASSLQAATNSVAAGASSNSHHNAAVAIMPQNAGYHGQQQQPQHNMHHYAQQPPLHGSAPQQLVQQQQQQQHQQHQQQQHQSHHHHSASYPQLPPHPHPPHGQAHHQHSHSSSQLHHPNLAHSSSAASASAAASHHPNDMSAMQQQQAMRFQQTLAQHQQHQQQQQQQYHPQQHQQAQYQQLQEVFDPDLLTTLYSQQLEQQAQMQQQYPNKKRKV